MTDARDWIIRMLEGGEDPLYVARRLVVVASEDVGLADSQGLPLVSVARIPIYYCDHRLIE